MAFLEFRQVAVAFGAYVAVEGVSLRVSEGEFVSLVGPTGCGKSTLLNVAAGLLPPTRGEVLLEGRPLRGLNPKAGYLFQQDAILPWKTALDNVALPLLFRGVPLKEARARARAWLAKVGLERFPDRYPHQLSGGMRKRVGLAQVPQYTSKRGTTPLGWTCAHVDGQVPIGGGPHGTAYPTHQRLEAILEGRPQAPHLPGRPGDGSGHRPHHKRPQTRSFPRLHSQP
ncbi:ATP-binding cassette domain-containing protein (plasmid) [Thermus oshimai]|uniref:ATP-binding cassette domain-containing protein n=1 Tax=Thermus oshimai TaxID=56957 RepID=UPI0039A5B068